MADKTAIRVIGIEVGEDEEFVIRVEDEAGNSAEFTITEEQLETFAEEIDDLLSTDDSDDSDD